ncbi:hypothetical protein GQX73_g1639 [Xylaria multiplex]|uniref:Uncharacterized protein n=1 Tax=Xylaria multiplex TaxID=323545 RepID=A0A7C8MZH8_9PEZI|nr:hypothetical protein GQX73_g1639 [Xylaria multiplex]
MVGAGTVNAAHVSRPRVSSIGRQTSYEAVVGGTNGISVMITTPPDESLQLGHSLNSVPEAHEEEDNHSRHVTRKRAVSESQQALLGDSDSEGRGGRASPPRIEQVEGLEDIELDVRKRRRDL